MKKCLAIHFVFGLALLVFAGCADTDSSIGEIEEPSKIVSTDAGAEEIDDEGESRRSLREEFGFIELWDDLATEDERLLMVLVDTHIARSSWESGDEIDPDSLVGFFLALCNPPHDEVELREEDVVQDDELAELLYPADLVESVIQAHFDVSTSHLQSGMYYIADVDAYWCAGLGSVTNAKIIDIEVRDNLRTISYELYHDTTYSGAGVLVVEGNDTAYRYLSNQFEPIPLTPEQEVLRTKYIQVQEGMPFEEKVLMGAVCSGFVTPSWEDAEENFPADLMHLYRFLVEIGEAEIPANTEIDRLWKHPYLEASMLEAEILAHFDTTTEFLRSSPIYDEGRNAYRLSPANMSATCIMTDFEYNGDVLTIQFDYYQSYSLDYTGELVVLTDGAGGYIYQSCRCEWVGE